MSKMQGYGLGRNVSVSRRTNVSSQSRLGLRPMHLGSRLGLGAICLGLGLVGLVPVDLVSGYCVSLRRFVQTRAVHTVAAVRTSMTIVA